MKSVSAVKKLILPNPEQNFSSRKALKVLEGARFERFAQNKM
jgi:hypothetical protein